MPGAGEATGGLVTAPDPRAAHAGALMLRAGGSAVDAAVATAFAIGVVEPYMSGLGGGAWLVIREPGARTATTVSGPIRAPGLARADMFPLAPGADPAGLYGWPAVAGDANIVGPLSVGTPGAVAALCRAHARFGLLPLAEVLAPAIELAEEGHQTNWFASSAICAEARNLRGFPDSAALFLPDGLPLRGPSQGPGDRLVQPRLAAVLREIADGGPDQFYRGRAGQAIAAFVGARGGPLRTADLAGYEAVEAEIDPVEIGPLRLYGPLSTGVVTVAEALQIVEAAGRRGLDPGPRLWARALARAFDDRLREVSPEQSGWERLAGAEHAERVVAEWHHPLPVTRGPAKAGCTSHLSAVDGRGMTVALTQTVLDLFGSRLVEPETGIVLNDGMMYFDPRPGQVTSISPGAAGLSAVSPIIVGGPGGEAVLGASGGRRIISAVAQIIARWRDGATLQAAVEAPRLHAEGRRVWLDRRQESAAADLAAAGHDVQVVEEEPTTWHFARPGGVERRPGRGWAPGVDRMKPYGVGVQERAAD
ncbi:gamma-glutamyltransferase [Acrocarpospora macrocephala]|uniref:Gamma-glutamyltransferase n=1 Tax=Acrocarpospora macrocephala TaxID=150177 RepID=A0A5M3WE75_9ACTN|nr:gamma-glutamyltransferase [Acrocarpospora macrocephala]GES07254.1 gamma-glutamyltransferase [Acrocarpospora macrocephala]